MVSIAERAAPNINDVSKVTRKETTYDRATQDAGNIIAIEHLNFSIGDQQTATAFYVVGLGFTRDPYMFADRIDNMAINIGRNQLHMPTAGKVKRGVPVPVQRVRGTIGFVVPDLGELAERLEKAAPLLKGTQFSYEVHADRVVATCPWGNRISCHAPSPEFGDTELALAYVEFDVPRGTAAGIARFYREALGGLTSIEE